MPCFGATLSRLRQESGFPTAYSFYHRNGGRKVFPFTFPHYRKIERGLSLPRPEWIPVFLSCLRLLPASRDTRELAKDYLRDAVGNTDVFRDLFEPLFAPEPAVPAGQKVVRRLYTAQAVHLSVEQERLISSSQVRFWAFHCLSSSRTAVALSRLAPAVGASLQEARRAAEDLVAARLVRRSGRDRYVCPFSAANVISPYRYPGWEEDRRRVEGFIDAMGGPSGKLLDMHFMARLDAAGQSELSRLLAEAVEKGSAFATVDPGAGTALVHVRSSVRRLFEF